MQLLDKLQKWFQIHCDGDWEHSYGVTIDTLDNPGWKISIDLNDTMLENIEFEAVCKGNSEDKNSFWIDCCKEDKTFVGMGSVDSLEKILAVFFEWYESNCDTTEWDEITDTLIKQCSECDNIDQLRKIYSNIDFIPMEHPRRQELVRAFEARWNYIINIFSQK